MTKGLKIAVVGATGAVGRELLSILEQRSFAVSELVPFASQRSKGKPIRLSGRDYPCRVLEKGCFDGVDVAFFGAEDAIAREWVPQAAEAGAWVIDKSGCFRMDEDILLVIPEVNGGLLKERFASKPTRARDRIIACPNCSTTQLVVALKPLHDRFGLKRVVASTFQSASGAGADAMDELAQQTQGLFNGKPVAPKYFAHRIAFNCIPQIGGFSTDGPEAGYTSEERKIIDETRKILGLPHLRITATAVRVPTMTCHSESVNIELERAFTVEEARAALGAQAGVVVQDDPARKIYPMGEADIAGAESTVESATGRDAVYVGRIRRDASLENGLNLWVVSDNLRKGAALNAVQIGEILLQSLR